MTGIGVNVTSVPEQTGLAEAAILTEGVALVTTVIVIELEVTVVGLAHCAFEVSNNVITSPFAKVVDA